MDTFENVVDINKFRYTNLIWNELKLNSPWNVGYVTTLIESKNFTTKEDWKEFYITSGQERLDKIKQFNQSVQDKLLSLEIDNSLPYHIKRINLFHGRTNDDLYNLASIMFNEIERRGNPKSITLRECFYMVTFRVIGETWNGIVVREKNTIRELSKHINNVEFRKVDGVRDCKYAIDYELITHNHVACAIQIKPLSYENGTSEEILKAKEINDAKNKRYRQDYGVEVYYVYSKKDGFIENPDIIYKIYNDCVLSEIIWA